MTAPHAHSFSFRFARAFVEETGISEDEARSSLNAAGICTNGLLATPSEATEAQVSAEQFSDLFRQLSIRLEDELPGLLSKPMRCGAMKYAALSVITAPNLGVALRRHARHLNLLVDDFEVSFEQGPAVTTIAFSQGPVVRKTKEVGFALMLKLFHGLGSWLVRRELPLAAVNLTFLEPPYADDLRKLFPGPVRFGCERGELVFDSTLLDLKAQRTVEDLRRCLDRHPRDWLSGRFAQQPLAARVREFLAQAEPRAYSIEAAAIHLGMSSRNLSRRLKEEGTSFQQIKDELRFDFAIIRLTQTADPLTAIADDLGFSDLSSFHRAFRSWSGVSPGSYRRRLSNRGHSRGESAQSSRSTSLAATHS